MDVALLLKAAREQSLLSQADLAKAATTSRSAITAYENSHVSPTVGTLNRLLAACGLQIRATLQPLTAEVDARVDALLAAEPNLDLEQLAAIADSLDDRPDAPTLGIVAPPARRGPVTWAFDAGTALGLHGLAVDCLAIGLVLVLDEASRFWLRAAQVRGQTPRGDVFMSWLDADLDDLRSALRNPGFCLLGIVEVRAVQQLPATVMVVHPGLGRPVPVVTVDEVERAHPPYAAVLARWRHRRTRDVA